MELSFHFRESVYNTCTHWIRDRGWPRTDRNIMKLWCVFFLLVQYATTQRPASVFFFQVLSFCVSTYAARWALMAVLIKTASNTKECEGTNTLAKITFIYSEKNANSEDASVQCIFLGPVACEERNSFGA